MMEGTGLRQFCGAKKEMIWGDEKWQTKSLEMGDNFHTEQPESR